MRIKSFFSVICLTMLLLVPFSIVQASANVDVTDITDKYRGEQVTIKGATSYQEVVVKVFDANDLILYVNVIPVTEGKYSKSFTLAEDAIYGTYKVIVGQNDDIASDTFRVKARESGNVGGGGGPGGGTPPKKEEIKAPVESGGNGNGTTVSETTINRTTNGNGVKDQVEFSAENAQQTVDKLKEQGQNTARIVIPDKKDEVSEIRLDVPKEAIQSLNTGKINLEIHTENARITVPSNSLVNFNQDLYFRVVPIKDEDERKQVEDRAKKEQIVQDVAGDKTVKVYGRPMTIETNMESRPVDLVLPLKDSLPSDPKKRDELLENLVIFIEHDDGTKELVKGTVVSYDQNTLGVQFGIEKFSTFTMVYMENWREYFAAQQQQQQPLPQNTDGLHKAYVAGYPNGQFKPSAQINRAEMAALLSRVYTGLPTKSNVVSYPDVTNGHWAKEAIQAAQNTGLMSGYPDQTFAPGKSITRAEMAAVIARWLQLGGSSTSSRSDVKGHWAEEVIVQVEKAKIMMGMPDGTFRPNQPLTRAEAVTIFNRILKRGPLNGVEQPMWTDVPAKHWAFKEIEEASQDHRFTQVNGTEQLIK